jgi:creatinine amidohydrolase
MQHEWRKLRADELRDQARRDAIVILPVASLEQHGPHLPVEVDSILAETVAARTVKKILPKGQAVLGPPVLWTGLSEHHMSFGGTATLDNATFAALIERGPLGAAARIRNPPDRPAQRPWRQ